MAGHDTPISQGILFISRRWEGFGGMQRLSRDLWSVFFVISGGCALRSVPHGRLPWCTFFCSLPLAIVRARFSGYRVHLGDMSLLPLGWFLSRICRMHVSITACGLDVIWYPRWYQWMLRRTIYSCSMFLAISGATADALRRRGVPRTRITILSPGTWHGTSQVVMHTSPRQTLFSVCRLIPRKGIAWFVSSVFPLLQREYPQCRYRIAGSGPEALSICSAIHVQKLDGAVEMVGSMDDRDVLALLSYADVFVVPNLALKDDMEGFGIACIEAASFGVPVVAAATGGLCDAVLEEETGFFFRSGDVQDCLRALCAALSGRLTRSMVSEAAFRRYSWFTLVSRYRQVFSC